MGGSHLDKIRLVRRCPIGLSHKVDDLVAGAYRDRIAAFRYLAWLDTERRFLIWELFPDRKRDDVVWFPCDSQVDKLVLGAPLLERAVPVLEAFGIYPYADDAWTDILDINLCDIPFAGTAK